MALVFPLDRPSSPAAARGPSPRRTTQAVHVVAWDDPEAPLGGIDVRSAYVERFWLPLLGAQATWLARRLAEGLDAAPDGFDLEVDETVRVLGLWGPGGSRSSFRRAVLRCVRHGFARHHRPGMLAARRRVPVVSGRNLVRLPLPLQTEHRRWVAERSSIAFEELRQRTRLAALDLLTVDGDLSSLEGRLLRWGVHPALAADSAAWAWDRRQSVTPESLDWPAASP